MIHRDSLAQPKRLHYENVKVNLLRRNEIYHSIWIFHLMHTRIAITSIPIMGLGFSICLKRNSGNKKERFRLVRM